MRKCIVWGCVVVTAAALLAGCGSKGEDKGGTSSGEASKTAYYEAYGFSDGEEPLAFPGADGYGKKTVGGRGGTVYHVTNLEDDGEGSLRWAIQQKGPRTVVFDVSGTIELKSMLVVQEPYLTVAGQTAPGDGICIKNFGLTVEADQVIVRYLRSRPGGSQETDALWVKDSNHVVIDHASTSWGTDETLSVSGSDKVTVMNCLISESLNVNHFGIHGMGSLVRGSDGKQVTFYRNVYPTHRSRMPMCGNYKRYDEDPVGFRFEFINNYVFNWNGTAAGKNHDVDTITHFNLIGNVYRSGRVSTAKYAWSEGCSYTRMYMEGNMMDGEIPEDQYSLVEIEDDNENFSMEAYRLKGRYEDTMTEHVLPAEKLEGTLLDDVGASLSRDEIDRAVIQGIRDGVGKIIDRPEQSLGWSGAYPVLRSEEPAADGDGDGMPDEWEKQVGLDETDGTDGAEETDCGYTNLEIYLESLIQSR